MMGHHESKNDKNSRRILKSTEIPTPLLEHSRNTTRSQHDNNRGGKCFLSKLFLIGILCGAMVQTASYAVACVVNVRQQSWGIGMMHLTIMPSITSLIVWVSSSPRHRSWMTSFWAYTYTGVYSGVFLAMLMIEWSVSGARGAQSLLSIRSMIIGASHLTIFLMLNSYYQRMHDLLRPNDGGDNENDLFFVYGVRQDTG